MAVYRHISFSVFDTHHKLCQCVAFVNEPSLPVGLVAQRRRTERTTGPGESPPLLC